MFRYINCVTMPPKWDTSIRSSLLYTGPHHVLHEITRRNTEQKRKKWIIKQTNVERSCFSRWRPFTFSSSAVKKDLPSPGKKSKPSPNLKLVLRSPHQSEGKQNRKSEIETETETAYDIIRFSPSEIFQTSLDKTPDLLQIKPIWSTFTWKLWWKNNRTILN